jgi:eukaryotic-like serine/threonine-protein kinase
VAQLPESGTLIDGKYQVEQVLGQGGVGVVVAALHVGLEQRVAVKLLRPHLAEGEAASRFLREARATVRLRGEHVARVTDVGTHDGAPYMVMELLDGKDLSDLLDERGPLPERETADLLLQAIEGVAEAHAAGMIHRDIKPANLFVTRRPDGTPLVKVLDFGISKVGGVEDGTQTSTQVVMGSPFYMAPEQMRATKDVDTRADIWSLGVTLFQCLTGRLPFEDENFARLTLMVHQTDAPRVRSLVPAVSLAMDELVARCLAREPADRFPSVAALAEALSPIASPEARRHGAAAQRLSVHPAASGGGPALSGAPPPRVDGLSSEPAAALARATVDDSLAERPAKKAALSPIGLLAAVVLLGALGAGAFVLGRSGDPLPTTDGAVASGSSTASAEVSPPSSAASSAPPTPATPAPEITPVVAATASAPSSTSSTASPATPGAKTAKPAARTPGPAGAPPSKGAADPFGDSRK